MCTYACVHMHVYMYMCTYACVYIHVYMYVHTYEWHDDYFQLSQSLKAAVFKYHIS